MPTRISATGQIKIYVEKCFRIFKNEKGWKNFISALIIVILLCFVTGDDMFDYAEETQKGSFALVCACIWIGLFNSIQSICRERAIIKREYRTGLRLSSYILAHVFFEAAVCFVECLLITIVVIVRNHANFPAFGVLLPAFLELFIDLYLVLLAADLMGILISCVAKTENAAMTAMPFVLIFQLVFAGTIFPLEGIADTLSNLTISRWGQAAICVTADINDMVLFYETNDYVYTVGNLLRLWGILLVFVVVFIVLSIFLLRLIEKDER